MNETEMYAAPKSELENNELNTKKANWIIVDLSFWLAHLGFIFGMIMMAPSSDNDSAMSVISLILLITGMLSMVVYFFAIGIFGGIKNIIIKVA